MENYEENKYISGGLFPNKQSWVLDMIFRAVSIAKEKTRSGIGWAEGKHSGHHISHFSALEKSALTC